MRMMRIKKNSRGFTFVEVLVSLGIFATATTIVAATFASAYNVERRSLSYRVVQENTEFILEFLGKEIRNGRIDYSAYNAQPLGNNPVDELHLVYRGTTYKERIFLDGSTVKIDREQPGGSYPGTPIALSSSEVIIEELRFYIRPFDECTESSGDCDGQQRVTVVLKVTSSPEVTSSAQPVTVEVQTTFSARVYDI